MPDVVVLLRGVNVGGANRLPMPELRVALAQAGFTDPRTYLNSGNVLVGEAALRASGVADGVRAVVRETFDLDVPVVAMTAGDWATIAASSPFDEPDPKRLHVIAFADPITDAGLVEMERLQAASDAKGRRDRVAARGRALYLHTPDGFGTSALARALTSRRAGPLRGGTARNWSTVKALLGLITRS